MPRLFRRSSDRPIEKAVGGWFVERLAEAGLGVHATQLAELARPSIRLRPVRVGEQETPVGTTRLGGRPDLLHSTGWPMHDGVPQSFIAQIDLADIRPFDRDGVLPERGLLSFFYDSEQRVWGYDPAVEGGWAVLYTPADAEIARHDFPDDLSEHGRFSAVALHPDAELTYAPWEFSEVAQLGLSREEQSAYAGTAEGDEGIIHRLLGHPDPIQGDMQLECQLVANGLYCGDATGYQDPRAEALRPGAADWRLLLQIDSDEDAGMMWGDVGRLYYWMQKDALAAQRWDEARLILQCC